MMYTRRLLIIIGLSLFLASCAAVDSISGVKNKDEQWADAFVAEYPNLSEAQKQETREWAIKARSGARDVQMPSYIADSDFNAALNAANSAQIDTTSGD
jgi:PBP1b-binding outer membrane lipoprotein LpoB